MKKKLINRRFAITTFSLLIAELITLKVFSNGNPYRDRFQSYRQTFRIEPNRAEAERIIKNIIKKRKVDYEIISLKAPDIAEDGNVVPITFSVKCKMESDDYPKKVHVLALENPFPEIAIYEFFPGMGKAEVSFRCRMRESADLIIIAEMADGRVAMKKKYVDVMLGACS